MKVGILGGGQLGLMLAQAARDLEIEPIVLDPKPRAVARRVARHLEAAWDDSAALDELAGCDVVTYEFENVPTTTVERLSQRVPVHPSPISLAISGDRVREKQFLRDLGIDTATFEAVSSRAELDRAVSKIGLPAILKTRRFGYDGKGQAVLRSPEDVDQAWCELGDHELVLEGFVPFAREISVAAVRDRDGGVRTWPATENVHVDGILHLSRAPAPDVPPALFATAARGLEAIMTKLDYVGVLVVEFFEVDGAWIANEIACRVHNSAHWTIEGATTSQFENHVRAVMGMPLGSTEVTRHSAMVNLVGRLPAALDSLADDPDIHVHVYGKGERSGRKIGHVTVVADSVEACELKVGRVLEVVGDRSAVQ